jgi:8-oxo-dGTP diphosphatase
VPADPLRARLVTLAFVRNGDDVLLLRHPARSRRFGGQWNGVGGHVERGEDVRAAARRELREEAGLDVPGLRLRAVIHETGLMGESWLVFVFAGETAARALHPGEGHELGWHPLGRLPRPLVHDVEILLPHVFAEGDPVFLTESYDGGDRRLSLRFDEPAPEARAPETPR